MTKSLTEGKPLKLILQFSAPILLSMLFQQFYNLIDTMIVGRILGENALAAVSSTSSINFMIIGFCMGVCSGFAIPMAQAFGAQEPHELRRYIGSCVWLCVIFSAVLAISTGLLCTQILRWMGTPEEILADASAYIGILFWGIPVTYLYNMTSSMLRAVGAANKLSVIFCCPFDALGAAIATYAGQNIGAGKPDRVREGVNSCMLLGSVYAVSACALFFAAGSTLATAFADPSNTVLIGYIRHMLVVVSLFYIPLTGVNVYRFCIQGMGYSSIAILAGVMEMFGRAGIAALVGIWGFNAACFAGPAAWILADSFLIPAYYHFLKIEKKRLTGSL